MARVLDALPERKNGTKTYPREWFDGRVWELTLGEDFFTPIASIRSTLAGIATRYGKSLITRKTGEVTLAIQAVPISTNGQVP